MVVIPQAALLMCLSQDLTGLEPSKNTRPSGQVAPETLIGPVLLSASTEVLTPSFVLDAENELPVLMSHTPALAVCSSKVHLCHHREDGAFHLWMLALLAPALFYF